MNSGKLSSTGGRGRRVLTLTSLYPPAFKGGGPIRTLEALVRSAPTDVKLAVVTGDRDVGTATPLAVDRNTWTFKDGVPCYYASADRLKGLVRMYMTIKAWQPDLLYLNSFFSRPFSIIPMMLRKLGWCRRVPVLLAPRGEFSPGALELKHHRKGIYLSGFKLLGLSRGLTWHASTVDEAEHIEAIFGEDALIVIREDETSLPGRSAAPEPVESDGLAVVFISRLDTKKGLDVLLEGIRGTTERIDLDVYGPETDHRYAIRCRKIASSMPPNVSVNFRGVVAYSEVCSVLARYELLAFPTAGENFGHVIAEALSVSCPVMCSPATPWTRWLEAGGGVIVKPRAWRAWAAAIDAYAKQTAEERFVRRINAGRIYNAWCLDAKGPHVFELVGGRASLRW